jgi:type I restriction enzyme S subunit
LLKVRVIASAFFIVVHLTFAASTLPKTEIEQTSIASILSKTDQAIASTEALIAKYSKIKTGLMQDLLTKGIDENGNIRTEETHGFTEENGFKYPKEWELTTIEKCIINIEQGWSPNCESDPAPTNEWGILKTTAVTWNGYDANENKKMPIALTPKYQYEVKNGDVLVTRAGPNSRVGVVSYVQQTRDKIIFSDKIYRLIPQKKLLNKYLALALSSQFTQRHLSNFKTGMAESQTNISQKIVLALNILLPSPEEQKQIIETLDKAEENLKIYGIVLSKLISIKTGLMQDLLTGKVRVKI